MTGSSVSEGSSHMLCTEKTTEFRKRLLGPGLLGIANRTTNGES